MSSLEKDRGLAFFNIGVIIVEGEGVREMDALREDICVREVRPSDANSRKGSGSWVRRIQGSFATAILSCWGSMFSVTSPGCRGSNRRAGFCILECRFGFASLQMWQLTCRVLCIGFCAWFSQIRVWSSLQVVVEKKWSDANAARNFLKPKSSRKIRVNKTGDLFLRNGYLIPCKPYLKGLPLSMPPLVFRRAALAVPSRYFAWWLESIVCGLLCPPIVFEMPGAKTPE